MLRVDNKAEWVKLPWSLSRIFSGRYAVQSGRRLIAGTWKQAPFDQIRMTQQERPVSIVMDGPKRALWHFHDSFYWEDEGFDVEDVQALILQRERRSQQKLNTARSLMRAEQAGKPTRIPISSEIKRAVFERDAGKCVECESSFDLQYDHVLPVSLGGATTVENLQLLCADCNRRKSNDL